jgi:hypothetical protein
MEWRMNVREADLPDKIRPVHTKMAFRPGSLKYVPDTFTVTGAANMPIEHSWKAPKMSISTPPNPLATKPTSNDKLTTSRHRCEYNSMQGSNRWKEQRSCQTSLSQPFHVPCKHTRRNKNIVSRMSAKKQNCQKNVQYS